MRYYTKEWYHLMQSQNYTLCMEKIPDKAYTEEEIQHLYQKKLEQEIASDRRDYDTPPAFIDMSHLLTPERFDPEDWLFVDKESGQVKRPQTPNEVREQLERERQQVQKNFENRPPFDPKDTISLFKKCYQSGLRYGAARYPAWVREQVDHRLLALSLLPESVYARLKQEEDQNRRKFLRIEKAAHQELERQQIPNAIRNEFSFHDARVLSLKKSRANYEMVLHLDGLAPEDGTPYVKVIFTKAALLEREKGLVIRTRMDTDGYMTSSCTYLYDELYGSPGGYEVHMLLRSKQLKYLTLRCEDIRFEHDIPFP